MNRPALQIKQVGVSRMAFRARKVFGTVRETGPRGIKSQNNCKVSCLETPSFWKYKENHVNRNTPEKFRDFRETGPRAVVVRKAD